jgi:hypothetical protein
MIDAVVITDLFKGNQLKELESWLDFETPYEQESNWLRSPDGSHMVKMCEELNTFHKYLIDKARDVFAIHNLLPTFSTINWYEPNVEKEPHIDTGETEYTILYNYFCDDKLTFTYNEHQLELEQGNAIAYCGSEFEHMVSSSSGVNVRLNFNFALPSNYFFVLGNHTNEGFEFPSGRIESEVGVDWL